MCKGSLCPPGFSFPDSIFNVREQRTSPLAFIVAEAKFGADENGFENLERFLNSFETK